MNTPKVSIIIPVFNQSEYTIKCLHNIDKYKSNTPYEILVVNNASTDDTVEKVSALMSIMPNLILINNDYNKLFAGACNMGAYNAKGEILVFLNNDTEPQSEWLDILINRLESDTSIGIVGPKLLFPDGLIQSCGTEFYEGMNVDHKFIPNHRYYRFASDDVHVNIPEEVTAITGACLMIRKNLFLEVGGFDESYGMYYEDLDLNLKIRQKNLKVFYEPKSWLIHYQAKSSVNMEMLNNYNIKAGIIFYNKWTAFVNNFMNNKKKTIKGARWTM